MAPDLPLGRGVREGSDWAVSQGEAYAVRNAMQADRVGGIVSPASSLFVDGDITTTATLSKVNVVIMPLFETLKKLRLKEARVTVSTGQASSTLKTAIYHLKQGSKSIITKIENSELSFDCSSAAVVTAEANSEININPSARLLFFAYQLTAGVIPTIVSNYYANDIPIGQRYIAGTELDQQYDLTLMTATTGALNYFPWVQYLSNEYAEIF